MRSVRSVIRVTMMVKVESKVIRERCDVIDDVIVTKNQRPYCKRDPQIFKIHKSSVNGQAEEVDLGLGTYPDQIKKDLNVFVHVSVNVVWFPKLKRNYLKKVSSWELKMLTMESITYCRIRFIGYSQCMRSNQSYFHLHVNVSDYKVSSMPKWFVTYRLKSQRLIQFVPNDPV